MFPTPRPSSRSIQVTRTCASCSPEPRIAADGREPLRDLASDETDIRACAANTLVAKGYLALTATRKARDESKSGDFKARTKAVEDRLRPLGAAPWEAIPNDLGLLRSLLTYPDEDVVRVIQDRLAKILPPTKLMTPETCAAWIKEHESKLKWNAAKGQYVE